MWEWEGSQGGGAESVDMCTGFMSYCKCVHAGVLSRVLMHLCTVLMPASGEVHRRAAALTGAAWSFATLRPGCVWQSAHCAAVGV